MFKWLNCYRKINDTTQLIGPFPYLFHPVFNPSTLDIHKLCSFVFASSNTDPNSKAYGTRFFFFKGALYSEERDDQIIGCNFWNGVIDDNDSIWYFDMRERERSSHSSGSTRYLERSSHLERGKGQILRVVYLRYANWVSKSGGTAGCAFPLQEKKIAVALIIFNFAIFLVNNCVN